MVPMAVNMRLKLYFIYWWKSSALSLQALLSSRLSSILFLIGKFARFGLFIGFLLALNRSITNLAGYSFDQLVIFFLVYNLFDLVGQIFYRGIYWFRYEIISGDFDFRLTKPINPLFQILTSYTDFLDIPLLAVVISMLALNWNKTDLGHIGIFAIVSFASVVLITAIHILVAATGVMTTAVEHTIWMFRDFATMARVPVDIYASPVRVFLTYVMPVGLVFTLPAKVLFGQYSMQFLAVALLLSLGFYLLSLRVWRYALQRYASASS